MKINMIGVGEAFDFSLATTSISIESDNKVLLLDCGYAAPHPIWQKYTNPETIDYIYITHWHADHFFGLPALFTRWWEEDRKKEIVVIGQKGTEKATKELLEMAYPGVFWDYEGKYAHKIGSPIDSAEGGLKKPHFKITFLESETETNIGPFHLSFAQTTHVRKTMAIRVEVKENGQLKSFGFSGDGDFSVESKNLFQNIDFLAHETYLLDTKILGHGCIADAITTAAEIKVKQLAILHINRNLRRNNYKLIQEKISHSHIPVYVPEPGDVYEI